MKKFITPILACVLAVGISFSSLAAQWKSEYDGELTEEMETVLASIEDEAGLDFLVSTNSAPAAPVDEGTVNATDGDESTYWTATAAGDYLQINFDGIELINTVDIYEEGSYVGSFTIEAWNGEDWITVYENTAIRYYHTCNLDTIATNAIRITINGFRNSGTTVRLGEVSAYYQAPVQRTDEFVNAGYVSKDSYLINYDSQKMSSSLYDSLTDVILIETFNWVRTDPTSNDDTGDDDFTIGQFVFETYNNGGTFQGYIDPFSEEGIAQMETIEANLVEQTGKALDAEDAPRYWICLTGGLIDKDNSDSSSHNMFADSTVLDQFVEDVLAFVDQYDWIYGVDVDWEYPTNASQYQDMAELFQKLSEGLHERGMELSAAVSPSEAGYMNTYNIYDSLDRINIMSYMSAQDQIHESMYQMIVNQIQVYVGTGCPISKIVVGMPYYAISEYGLSAATPIAFKEIYRKYQTLNWDYEEDYVENGIMFEFPDDINGLSYGTYEMVFNSQYTLRDKVEYCVQSGVKGVFNWQQINDIPSYEEDEITVIGGYYYNGTDSLARAVAEAIDQLVVNPE